MVLERLQKVLARAGIASRRHAEALIVAGRVRVNGRVVTELGTRVDEHNDKIEVDGTRIVTESFVYAILHKPRGVVTTLNDPEGRPTIADMVRSLGARVFPVGRLDYHTSGALLVTNDGALAQALLHPRQHVPKVYVCKVRGVATDLQLAPWREGMMLPRSESDPDERPTKTMPADVRVLRSGPPGENSTSGAGSTWIQVTLREGRTRQIHRMAEATRLFVMRLARLSFADITTEGLRPGELRNLTDKEVTDLRVKYLRPVEQGALVDVLAPEPVEAPPAKKRPAAPAARRRVAPADKPRTQTPTKPRTQTPTKTLTKTPTKKPARR
jgi:23S rRNA pseudouridine2605 synthase